jgi:hypothetical protein
LFLVVISDANAGYWKFIGVQGIANPSSSDGTATATFSGNSVLWIEQPHKDFYRHQQYSWSGFPDKIFPGRKVQISAEGKLIKKAGWTTCSIGLGFHAGGGFGGPRSMPDTSVASEPGCGARRVNFEIDAPEGSPDKNDSAHYAHIIPSVGLNISNRTADAYKYVYEWIADSSQPGSSNTGGQGQAGASAIILNTTNSAGVTHGRATNPFFTVHTPYQITKIMTYHYGALPSYGTIALRSSSGTTYGPWQMSPYANAWFTVYPNVTIPAGTYQVIDSDPRSWSHNAQSNDVGMTVIEGFGK